MGNRVSGPSIRFHSGHKCDCDSLEIGNAFPSLVSETAFKVRFGIRTGNSLASFYSSDGSLRDSHYAHLTAIYANMSKTERPSILNSDGFQKYSALSESPGNSSRRTSPSRIFTWIKRLRSGEGCGNSYDFLFNSLKEARVRDDSAG